MPTRLSANYYGEQAMAGGKPQKEEVGSVANAPSVCVFNKHKSTQNSNKQHYNTETLFLNNIELNSSLLTEEYCIHNNRFILLFSISYIIPFPLVYPQ